MAEDRGDSRVSSFLVGFLVGSLLAGGATTGFFVWQEYRLAQEAKQRAREATYRRALAAVDLLLVQTESKEAQEALERAEAALKKMEGK
jgi:hypothetical protein